MAGIKLFWIGIMVLIPTGLVAQANFDDQIQSLSKDLAEQIKNDNKKSVAITDFTDLQGNVTELGKFIAEEFGVALAANSYGFEVVDRSRLNYLIKENNLSSKAFIDPQTTTKLGKLAGVQAIIIGTLTPFGDNVRLTIKILDIEKATVIGATRGNLARTGAVNELLSTGISSSNAFSSGSNQTQNFSNTSDGSGITVTSDAKHIDRDCKEEKKGTARFFNKTKKTVILNFRNRFYTMAPNEAKYIYSLDEKSNVFKLYNVKEDGTRDRYSYDEGNIKIWACEITTYQIRK